MNARLDEKLALNYPLAPLTWFKAGGCADYFYKADTITDLMAVLAYASAEGLPYWVLGAGSNIIVRNGGFRGMVIRLGRGFFNLEREGDCIIAGAGVLDSKVSQFALANGLGGLSFLRGIPGTVGGALVMNAGCYGQSVSDILVWVEVIVEGEVKRLYKQDLSMSYRQGNLPLKSVVVRACFQGEPMSQEVIEDSMNLIAESREKSQPIREKTGGSTFKNPEGLKAWELIHKAGLRGFSRSGVRVSELHCNFLINESGNGNDIEDLGTYIIQKVYEQTGVRLEWEIKIIGER